LVFAFYFSSLICSCSCITVVNKHCIDSLFNSQSCVILQRAEQQLQLYLIFNNFYSTRPRRPGRWQAINLASIPTNSRITMCDSRKVLVYKHQYMIIFNNTSTNRQKRRCLEVVRAAMPPKHLLQCPTELGRQPSQCSERRFKYSLVWSLSLLASKFLV
jgi:hypothetical protein